MELKEERLAKFGRMAALLLLAAVTALAVSTLIGLWLAGSISGSS